MTLVGIIPARAGSKRLPHKNLMPLGSQPLLGHTCRAASDSGVLDEVFINTDSPELASLARDSGVPCPVLRPAHLAADDTPTREANLFLLDWLRERGQRFDAVVILQPTSPLRSAEDIRNACLLFEEHAPCAVVSVAPLVREDWAGTIGRDGRFERQAGRRQLYRLNGAIYVHCWDDYVGDRPPRKTIAYPMPTERSVDIDTPEDLELARFWFERRRAAAREQAAALEV